MEHIFWLFMFIMWWICWRPGMLRWWRGRRVNKSDLMELRTINYVEDMFW